LCRIVGIWDRRPSRDYDIQAAIVSMRDALAYGGPDDAGVYVDEADGFAMGHRRLSILDLSPSGHQPMSTDDQRYWITYNGEVYNFLEVRAELERKGYRFKSRSDTEVILRSYLEWGINSLQKFRGMFAIGIWDRVEKKLVLIRDRLGVKPLYWYYSDGLFLFASELKAFQMHPRFAREIDPLGISYYLQNGYIPSPQTIFRQTRKLKPGCFLTLRYGEDPVVTSYWSASSLFESAKHLSDGHLAKSDDEVIKDLEIIMKEAFSLRMVSDVPVGVFLSGGIDSSLLATLLTTEGFALNTFTVGFKETEYDEAKEARKLAEFLGTKHNELYCTPREAADVIRRLPEIYDEPFSDPSAIPTYLVAQLARRDVKVSLSADGGDEQFCGYSRYRINLSPPLKVLNSSVGRLFAIALTSLSPETADSLFNIVAPLLPKFTGFKNKYAKLKRAVRAKDQTSLFESLNIIFDQQEMKDLTLSNEPNSGGIKSSAELDRVNAMFFRDITNYLPDDILTKVDRATMAVALEGREPFLDHKLMEYAMALPLKFKYRSGKGKFILRKMLAHYLPKEITQRPKRGFELPIGEWFKSDLKEYVDEYLAEQRLERLGLLNPDFVRQLKSDYFDNRVLNHDKLWNILMLQMWLEKWVA